MTLPEEFKPAGRRPRRPSFHVWRVLVVAVAHFVVTLLLAAVAFGWDMDQLRSRSIWSRGAAAIHDVLWLPHDAALRALPNDWLARNTYVIPAALVLNSVVWGTILYSLWQAFRRLRRIAP